MSIKNFSHLMSILGPILWYQEFEYAIGHWLQKATEHVFGCVLCAPGCFSLFRGSALMDDNVARSYAIRTTEAGQYVQYDQGEWSCLSSDDFCLPRMPFCNDLFEFFKFLMHEKCKLACVLKSYL